MMNVDYKDVVRIKYADFYCETFNTHDPRQSARAVIPTSLPSCYQEKRKLCLAH